MGFFIDYIPAQECENPQCWAVCLKCGKCGRVFDTNGYMIDTGGTHIEEEEDDAEN